MTGTSPDRTAAGSNAGIIRPVFRQIGAQRGSGNRQKNDVHSGMADCAVICKMMLRRPGEFETFGSSTGIAQDTHVRIPRLPDWSR